MVKRGDENTGYTSQQQKQHPFFIHAQLFNCFMPVRLNIGPGWLDGSNINEDNFVK
jgi:hypothetical protein